MKTDSFTYKARITFTFDNNTMTYYKSSSTRFNGIFSLCKSMPQSRHFFVQFLTVNFNNLKWFIQNFRKIIQTFLVFCTAIKYIYVLWYSKQPKKYISPLVFWTAHKRIFPWRIYMINKLFQRNFVRNYHFKQWLSGELSGFVFQAVTNKLFKHLLV